MVPWWPLLEMREKGRTPFCFSVNKQWPGYTPPEKVATRQIKNPPHTLRGFANWLEKFYAARTTLPAWKPLGPLSRSNSTVSPSFSER